MIEIIENLARSIGISIGTLAILGVGFGSMLVIFGLSGVFAGKDSELRRMAEQGGRRASSVADRGILKNVGADPTGLMKALIPTKREERSEIQRQLMQAGMTGPHAVRNYYLVRLCAGILLPIALLAAIYASRVGMVALPAALDRAFGGWSQLRILQVLSFLVAVGFFGPAFWIRSRAAERRRAIEESFPNALDLIQISVEAGLGFDAAMIRVGNEIEKTAPEISYELLAAQREIQAGRGRDKALLDMAARTGVDEVTSFANVVLQSIQFGTSISDTLTTYAKEMRIHRELRAQEKANKLPVQMSAVMASIMLPALLLLTLGPMLIRLVRFFA
ncbi:MAG: type II secretion system F family protein [Sulfitobacter sp.]